MWYGVEVDYFDGVRSVDPEEALRVTARAVAPWCNRYRAKLLAPRQGTTPTEKEGPLPQDPKARAPFVEDIITWILASSEVPTFCLRLWDEATVKFEYPDEYTEWHLNLTPEEFSALQETWEAHGLPPDLFYPLEQGRCIPWPGQRWWDKVLRRLGVQKCFTPRQWTQYLYEREDEVE